jgi:Family of unknown function (DUF6118)
MGAVSTESWADEADPAVMALEGLKAEIAALRRDLGAREKTPDYSPTLGAMSTTLKALSGRLSVMEQHPAFQMMPDAYDAAIRGAGAGLVKSVHVALSQHGAALEAERVRIAGLVSQARTAAEQKRWLQAVGAAGLGLGLFLFPLIAAFAPGGSYLAAWTRGSLDRWQAGVDLLSAANPNGVAEVNRVWTVAQENRETLNRCIEAARQSKEPQACTITVPVMPP